MVNEKIRSFIMLQMTTDDGTRHRFFHIPFGNLGPPIGGKVWRETKTISRHDQDGYIVLRIIKVKRPFFIPQLQNTIIIMTHNFWFF